MWSTMYTMLDRVSAAWVAVVSALGALLIITVVARRGAGSQAGAAPRPRLHLPGAVVGVVVGAVLFFVLLTKVSPQGILAVGLLLLTGLRALLSRKL